jgi:hypothetical protein
MNDYDEMYWEWGMTEWGWEVGVDVSNNPFIERTIFSIAVDRAFEHSMRKTKIKSYKSRRISSDDYVIVKIPCGVVTQIITLNEALRIQKLQTL